MEPLVDPDLESYAVQHSKPRGSLLQALEEYTYGNVEDPQMVVGALEGAFLDMLVKLTGARTILEVGLFTGYSAIAMAEALPDSGRVVSCEISKKHAEIAQSFIDRSPAADKIEVRVGPAQETIAQLDGPFDLVFLDADKEGYCNYFDLVLPKMNSGGLIVADNVLWSGKVLNPQAETDHALVAFNRKVRDDSRVENVLLTVRDGMMLIRKK